MNERPLSEREKKMQALNELCAEIEGGNRNIEELSTKYGLDAMIIEFLIGAVERPIKPTRRRIPRTNTKAQPR